MHVARVRVTGGFLSGLDVKLHPGLNVLIGGRGAGKTTLLELMRHTLLLSHIDRGRDAHHQAYIQAILGSGQVVLDVVHDSGARDQIIADAEGAGRRTSYDAGATMVGQNELEYVASDSSNRRQLVDLRAGWTSFDISTQLGEITRKTAVLRAGILQIASMTERLPGLESDLEELRAKEAQLLSNVSADATDTRATLSDFDREVQAARASLRDLTRLSDSLAEITLHVNQASAGVGAILNDGATEQDEQLREAVQSWALDLSVLSTNLESETARLSDRTRQLEAKEKNALLAAQPLRSSLETAERGLGEVTAEIQRTLNQIAELSDLREGMLRAIARLTELLQERNEEFDRVERQFEAFFEKRAAVAKAVSSDLRGAVTVTIDHLGDTREYASRLTELMKNSSLQYRTIVDRLAQTILPRHLVQIVESNDVEALSNELEISPDRASRMIEHLDHAESLASIAEAQLEDRVDFWLIDSGVRRNIEAVSTGQKCAVTLPFLLTEHKRALILDQPEDNLDNAYLVSNIVSAIRNRRDAGAQTIVATHNANIPVLGAADLVVTLSSDGMRGSVTTSGPLDAPATVDQITRLMEGGADAFALRAKFYNEHGTHVDLS